MWELLLMVTLKQLPANPLPSKRQELKLLEWRWTAKGSRLPLMLALTELLPVELVREHRKRIGVRLNSLRERWTQPGLSLRAPCQKLPARLLLLFVEQAVEQTPVAETLCGPALVSAARACRSG